MTGRVAQGRSKDRPGKKEDSVGGDGSLDFAFVDVEVGIDVLDIIVFFERFDELHHLLCL